MPTMIKTICLYIKIILPHAGENKIRKLFSSSCLCIFSFAFCISKGTFVSFQPLSYWALSKSSILSSIISMYLSSAPGTQARQFSPPSGGFPVAWTPEGYCAARRGARRHSLPVKVYCRRAPRTEAPDILFGHAMRKHGRQRRKLLIEAFQLLFACS